MNANTRRPWRLIASILTTSALCLITQSSLAAGINLSWDECGSMGSSNKFFACNSNTLSHGSLIASFIPTIESGFATSRELVFDLVSASATVPDWWQLGPGGCRNGAMSLDADFAAGPFSCNDMWSGVPVTIGSTYTTTFAGRPDRARIVVTMQGPDAIALPPEYAEYEWYALRITLSGARTVGPASCGNCVAPVCMVFNSLRLVSPQPFAPATLTLPLDRNWVTWQGGAVSGGCPAATPARNTTWGGLKSLYH